MRCASDGRTGHPVDDVGRGEGADLLPHGGDQALAQRLAGLLALRQRHVRVQALALDLVLHAARRHQTNQFNEAALGLLKKHQNSGMLARHDSSYDLCSVREQAGRRRDPRRAWCENATERGAAHPTTAASMQAPCAESAASTSAVPTRCPDTLITSSTRPVMV